MDTELCCPTDRISCGEMHPIGYFFKRETKSKSKCEPVFGLKDTVVYYKGCFTAIYQYRPRGRDRIIVEGMPDLEVTDVWLSPASSGGGFVIAKAWRMESVTFFELDENKMPSFKLSILDKNTINLQKVGVPANERLVRCGDLL